jgi:CheY-like chemotaxis protein
VSVTHNPTAALSSIDTGQPVDLVITDVMMPELTGPELAKAIRRRRPRVPIVYTSGYTAGTLGDRVQLDSDAVLVEKPFSRTTLLDAIETVLGTAKASGRPG